MDMLPILFWVAVALASQANLYKALRRPRSGGAGCSTEERRATPQIGLIAFRIDLDAGLTFPLAGR